MRGWKQMDRKVNKFFFLLEFDVQLLVKGVINTFT